MRSFLLKAAIAAVLATAPISISYAAGHGRDHESLGGRANSDTGGDGETASEWMHDGPWGSLVTAHQQMPVLGFLMQQPRLAVINADLNQATHRINRDRHNGSLNAAEARVVRKEDSAIQTAALRDAARNGGRLTYPEYRVLSMQVAQLDRTIDRYAAHA